MYTGPEDKEEKTSVKVSVAIPVFNEELTLPTLLGELRPVLDSLGCEYEIVFVNDGSRDGTQELLDREAAKDRRIKVLSFSRNFGQQAAVTAGLDFSTGDAVVMMDSDLQDPPELIPELVRLYREGYDVVSPQRVSRDGESWWKRKTASLFYRLMKELTGGQIAAEVGDFRLLSRSAVIALREFREQHRFVRGMVAWLGLREAFVPFHRRTRAGGETKYGLWKMVLLSWTAITSFSALPLRLTMLGGIGASALAVIYFFYAAYVKYVTKSVVQGWTSIVFLQCFFFGVTLLSIGIVGQYIARIYDESKGRPLYVITASRNVEAGELPAGRVMILPSRQIAAKGEAPRG